MEQLSIALAVIGSMVILIGLLSKPIQRSLVQEPMIAVLVGVGIGPYGLGWLDMATWGDPLTLLETASWLTLAVGLMGVALRLKRESVKVLWRPVAILLTFGMIGMWLVSSLLSGWLLGLSVWTALLLGAAVTPTDPITASAIVTGPFAQKHLPLRVRDALSFESGANDGLAYLLVMLPALMILHPPAEAWPYWFLHSFLRGVCGAAVLGMAIGWGAAKLLVLAQRHCFVEEPFLLGHTLSLALLTLGAAHLIGADALISVFLAGLVFNLCAGRQEEHRETTIQETVAKLVALPMFVLFGLTLPFAEWVRLGWPLLGLAILVLLLRRPPVVLILQPWLRRWLNMPDIAYLAWFGPLGIAAIYYATFASRHIHNPMIWHVASALIFASILVHGVSAVPLTRLYFRHPAPAPRATRCLRDRE